MKTLHLLRHAKSSWDEPGLADRERPLNPRGRRDAPRMGVALATMIEPMPVDTSPARRARLTLEGVCRGWPGLARLTHRTDEALYTFQSRSLASWIARQDDRQPALFLIGHNPALTDLINELSGEDALANLPTAGYARLSLPVDRWRHLVMGAAALEQTLFPRQLRDR